MRAKVKPPPGCPDDAIVLTFPVAREFAGMRLDLFVQSRIPRLSRTRAKQIVKACAYRADGSRRRPAELVKAGETVMLVRTQFEEPDAPSELPVLYEDGLLWVVDKPAGLPVHPSASYHKSTVAYILREQHGEGAPRIAHRLDRETSGVLVCARGIEAERRVKNAFETRQVQKTYLAIVRGEIAHSNGRIELPLTHPEQGPHFLMETCPVGEGLPAQTEYEVVDRRSGHSLVKLWPRTGRQHQLRVHLAAIGHSIVGDKLYGPEGDAPFMEWVDTGMTDALRARLGHDRHALHAHALGMAHPETGESVRFVAPLAHDLRDLWERLGQS